MERIGCGKGEGREKRSRAGKRRTVTKHENDAYLRCAICSAEAFSQDLPYI